LVNRDLQAVRN
jgi:uncharacterized protein involved in exopolysaccharide biosynthesis